MKIETISSISNFLIKVIILFTTFLLLVFFSDYYNNLVFIWLALLLAIAIIGVGMTNLGKFFKDRERKR